MMKEHRFAILSAAWAAHILFTVLGHSFVGISVLLPSILVCGLATWLYDYRIGLITLVFTHPCHMLVMMYNLHDSLGWKAALEPRGLSIAVTVQLGAVFVVAIIKNNHKQIARITADMELRIRERNEELRRITEYIIVRSEAERSRMSEVFYNIIVRQQSDLYRCSREIKQYLSQVHSPHAAAAAKLEQLAGMNMQQVTNLRTRLSNQSIADHGIQQALTDMCDMIAKTADTRFTIAVCDRLGDLTDETCLNIYRIAHEAVTNALRHGKATHIHLSLQRQDHQCILDIINNGIPMSGPLRYGLGLKLIQQRAELLNAAFFLEPTQQQKTRFRCIIPLQAVPSMHAAPMP